MSDREHCTREVEILTLAEQRDNLYVNICDIISELNIFKDSGASANSNATLQTDLDEFHFPIPTPRTTNTPPPIIKSHAESSHFEERHPHTHPRPSFIMQLAKPHTFKPGDDIVFFLYRFKQFVTLSKLTVQLPSISPV